MEKRCGTCRHWTGEDFDVEGTFGECHSAKANALSPVSGGWMLTHPFDDGEDCPYHEAKEDAAKGGGG